LIDEKTEGRKSRATVPLTNPDPIPVTDKTTTWLHESNQNNTKSKSTRKESTGTGAHNGTDMNDKIIKWTIFTYFKKSIEVMSF
jgi:hypothetical protein